MMKQFGKRKREWEKRKLMRKRLLEWKNSTLIIAYQLKNKISKKEKKIV